jgi:hypothetical protein
MVSDERKTDGLILSLFTNLYMLIKQFIFYILPFHFQHYIFKNIFFQSNFINNI